MAWIVPVLVACSTFGSANGVTFAGGRLDVIRLEQTVKTCNFWFKNFTSSINTTLTSRQKLVTTGAITLPSGKNTLQV